MAYTFQDIGECGCWRCGPCVLTAETYTFSWTVSGGAYAGSVTVARVGNTYTSGCVSIGGHGWVAEVYCIGSDTALSLTLWNSSGACSGASTVNTAYAAAGTCSPLNFSRALVVGDGLYAAPYNLRSIALTP
jgi:hypothetical protein